MSDWNLKSTKVGEEVTAQFTGDNKCQICHKKNNFGEVRVTFFGIVEYFGRLYYSFVPCEPMICERCLNQVEIYLEQCDEDI